MESVRPILGFLGEPFVALLIATVVAMVILGVKHGYTLSLIHILNDLYALDRELDMDTGEACFDQIAARNQLKTRLQEKVDLSLIHISLTGAQ